LKLYLIPSFLAENTQNMIPQIVNEVLKETKYYLVENERTARRFIAAMDLGIIIQDLKFYILDKRTKRTSLPRLFEQIPNDQNVGILSEAGCPGIADPGAVAATWAHRNNIEVIALPGPSSIFLALMASGFSGQNFTFRGYIPLKDPEREQFFKDIISAVEKEGATQLFMETPYRNEHLLNDLLKNLPADMQLSIAANLTAPDQLVKTMPVKIWKKQKPQLRKVPAIFSVGVIN
jgi:16S rRNA (cytidine1402-2'-O)-methyltransferase